MTPEDMSFADQLRTIIYKGYSVSGRFSGGLIGYTVGRSQPHMQPRWKEYRSRSTSPKSDHFITTPAAPHQDYYITQYEEPGFS